MHETGDNAIVSFYARIVAYLWLYKLVNNDYYRIKVS
jgi:hypothetical protein